MGSRRTTPLGEDMAEQCSLLLSRKPLGPILKLAQQESEEQQSRLPYSRKSRQSISQGI